jgi:hypothetical protein
MATLTMSGYGLKHLPTRTLREAARTAVDPYAEIVSTGNIRAWDLFSLRASGIPGAPDWADKTLDSIVAAAFERFRGALDCEDCQDVGFYGLVDRSDPDILTSLLRRVDDGNYEVLTASAGWKPYDIVADQHLEVLTRDMAGDLAEAVTSGASGLVRRYFMPAAFLPPDTMIAAGPAPELTAPDVAVDSQDALDPQDAADGGGWVSYAVVDDLDPGAVLDVIRLRRGPAGPELAAYRSGAWAEAPDLLSQLQGVQPPPLVELSDDQLTAVLHQIDDSSPGSADSGDPGEGLDEADQSGEGAQAVAASMGLTAAAPTQDERDKAAAKGQALPEGGFPIQSHDDLKKAVKAFGRAKNPTAAKRHIIKRAKAIKGTHLLPDTWGVTAAFSPNRVPAGGPGGGEFAPLGASEQAAAQKKAKQDAADAQKKADHDRQVQQAEEDRQRKISEHEDDRQRKITEHQQDRERKIAEHAQDRALAQAQKAAQAAATAAKKKAVSTAKKGSAAKAANYGNGGVASYDPKAGTIRYKDGSTYSAKGWTTATGQKITASGTLLALVADAPLTVSPDPRAEKLRRYWSEGKGALKIRWGTPGDWKRCYRHLSKFMGLRAKGYCQNLHKRSTGIWTGSRLNPGGHRGRGHALAASGSSGALSMEDALVAAVSTGRWFCPEGGNTMLKDGIYVEGGENVALLRTLTAGGFPVNPPEDWFENPQLDEPTPLTVDDDGRVYGHIATRDVAHIGLPGRVKAPVSKSNYAYFKTGQLVTASGKKVNVGQLTLAGGHAPLQADAASAVAHYDNTASAAADVNCGDDKWGIWVAGALRPEVTPSQLRTLRASAPSGDWRPINGNLELVACCQVNVPGFPVVRARVASGAITSLVAAGAGPLYARRLALMADASVAERLQAVESVVFSQLTEGLENQDDVLVADGDAVEGAEPVGDPISIEQAQAEGLEPSDGDKPVSDAVKRAREAARARREAKAAESGEQPQEAEAEAAPEDAEREARRAALRARVHAGTEALAASAAPKTPVDPDGDGDDDSVPGGPGDTDAASDTVSAVPGANPDIVHSQIAQGQGLGDLSHSDLVSAVHGDYKGDVSKFSSDLAKGKVKKPKKMAAAS